MTRMMRMNRRVFLRGVGGAAVAAPFLSSVHERQAKAAGSPRRLVIFYTHNGCLTDRWFPKVTNGALTADALTGGTLQPLAPYADKLLIPRGYRSMNAYAQGQSIDPHDQAMGSKLTCATIDQNNKRYATAMSLDHVIAKQINPGGKTPLVLSVGAASTNIKEVLSFSDAGVAFPAVVNPTTVYNQLTGVFGTGSVGTPTGPSGTAGSSGSPSGGTGQPGLAAWQIARGKSAIDLVRGDLNRFKALEMSRSDQTRVSDWLDLLRTTENQLDAMRAATGSNTMSATPSSSSFGGLSCSKASAEGMPFGVTAEALTAGSPTGKITLGNVLGNTPDPVGDANLAISFTKGGDLMLNLIALSMICDTNRMIMMVYPGYVTFNWDGIMHTKEHHGLSHRTGDFSVGGACGVAGVLDMINQIDQWYAGKYAKLVGLLNSIQEGDVKLLDNTATMWLPELSDGAAHNLNNLPIVIAGGCGGYLKQGQVVNVDSGTPQAGNSDSSCKDGGNIGNTGSSGGNRPINKLYVTLMNAVGCKGDDGGPVTKFGQFDGTGSSGGITNPGEETSLKKA